MIDVNDYSNIGESIKQIRKSENMCQEELAYLSGYTSCYICRIEKARDIPRVKVIEDVLDAMGYRLVIGIEKKGENSGCHYWDEERQCCAE